MAADALIALGHMDVVPGWMRRYRRFLEPKPGPVSTIPDSGTEWRSALGDIRRIEDWIQFMRRALATAEWSDVLELWWRRLLPGISAAAAHGVLRTAHATRALVRASRPEPPLLDELACGMGYWAARYRALTPTRRLDGTRPLDEALALIPRLAPEASPVEPGIMGRLVPAARLPHLPDAVDALRPDPDVHSALSSLTGHAARVFLTQPNAAIPLVHALTAPAAVRLVLPRLSSELHAPSFDAVWRLSSIIVSAYDSKSTRLPREATEGEPVAPGELVEQAVRHGDEHVLKMTEACLREYRLRNDPAYLLAAEASRQRIPRGE
ncbi:questin oxidase family protein [Embleya sp. NPDC055664]